MFDKFDGGGEIHLTALNWLGILNPINHCDTGDQYPSVNDEFLFMCFPKNCFI